MIIAIVAVTSSLVLSAKGFGCDSEEIKTIAVTNVAWFKKPEKHIFSKNYDSFYALTALVRIGFSVVMTFLTIYAVSNAGVAAIGFGATHEVDKWVRITKSLSLGGLFGRGYVVLFFLTTFNVYNLCFWDSSSF